MVFHEEIKVTPEGRPGGQPTNQREQLAPIDDPGGAPQQRAQDAGQMPVPQPPRDVHRLWPRAPAAQKGKANDPSNNKTERERVVSEIPHQPSSRSTTGATSEDACAESGGDAARGPGCRSRAQQRGRRRPRPRAAAPPPHCQPAEAHCRRRRRRRRRFHGERFLLPASWCPAARAGTVICSETTTRSVWR
jgi:hypothetical protein